MEKRAMLQKRVCRICFNNENNITLTKLNVEKLLQNCETYLDTSVTVIIKSFESEIYVRCCNYCYESSRQLTILEEKVQKLQKEILDFSLLFSKTVLERRSLFQNEDEDRNDNRLAPQIEIISIQNNQDRGSIVLFENTIVKKEVNASVSNELSTNSERTTENDNLLTYSWFDTVELENITEDECDNVVHSNDEIDVKYSCDETFSNVVDAVNEEIVPNQEMSLTIAHGVPKRKTMSMPDLLKSVRMPIIHLQRYLPERNQNSPKIVACAVEENMKYENSIEDSSDPNNYPDILTKEIPFKCREISRSDTFTSKCEFFKHQKIHSGMKKYQCSVCSESFARSDRLKHHEIIHSGKKPYKCSICSKSFGRSDNLKVHERIHSGERSYKCLICSKSFKTSDNLKKHKILHSEERPFKCSFCEKSFKTSSSLWAHERIHSASAPYKCSLCEKSFKFSHTLKKHKAIHSEKRPYQCSLCEKSFSRPTYLTVHERSHTGERPFKCSFCSKSFYQSGDLNRHKKIHTGERPYNCSFCSKSFHRLDEAKRHEMTHTGEKPHKCSSCGSTFRRRVDLTNHFNRMHGERENNQEYILS